MRMFLMLSPVLVKATNYQMPPSQELNNMSASYIFLVHKLLRLVLYIGTFFSKKQAEAEKLPPTHGALVEKIMSAHYQAVVWWHDDVPQPEIPVPSEYGWKEENDELLPVPSKEKSAPDAVLQFVKCGCKKSSCMSSLCSCVKNNLVCTEMCFCAADDDICQNTELCLQTYKSNDNDDKESSV